ncbi:ImmA/IrrE family metallo-endopeptidase [Faecalibaculum rodentium]|uniref:ImmA/IrrE family metallo-endopeptidase n=1 Tax=Faecalibaculum rodentium TaxID=1702221 RepID=UPI0025B75FE5|nr:ImmA/IrrE family metallo-endopeptidase [Faecalibaculum rodentium]
MGIRETEFVAKPTSRAKLRESAKKLRKVFNYETGKFPVLHFLEGPLARLNYDFDIVDYEVLGPFKEAEAYPDERIIYIRSDVYDKAYEGDPRSLFTIAHEIAHLLLHKKQNIKLVANGFARSTGKIPAYKDPEWQANAFAAELLAPADLLVGMTVEEVVEKFGVSMTCANIQLQQAAKLA